MLCGTRWLAEVQRRVEKDRNSGRERWGKRERERGRHTDTNRNKGIKDKEVLDKITLKRRQWDIWH